MAINVLAFWPFDLTGTTKTRKFAYSDPTGVGPSFSSLFSYDPTTRQLVCADYDASGNWKDDWRLVYDPPIGVCEVADWYPQSNPLLEEVFGPIQKENLSTPIEWGGTVSIGQIISNNPVYDAETSTPPVCVHGSGTQAIQFEALLPSMTLSNGATYKNVLQFWYAQSWNGGVPEGARYWMAEGVGPIAIQWLGFNAAGQVTVTEPRCDAVVTNT